MLEKKGGGEIAAIESWREKTSYLALVKCVHSVSKNLKHMSCWFMGWVKEFALVVGIDL